MKNRASMSSSLFSNYILFILHAVLDKNGKGSIATYIIDSLFVPMILILYFDMRTKKLSFILVIYQLV